MVVFERVEQVNLVSWVELETLYRLLIEELGVFKVQVYDNDGFDELEEGVNTLIFSPIVCSKTINIRPYCVVS